MRFAALLSLLVIPAAAEEDPQAPDFTIGSFRLHAVKEKKAVVLLFMGLQCPRSAAAEPRLCEMAKQFPDVAFTAINSNWHESRAEIDEHLKKSGFTIPVLKDEGGRVAILYKVEVEPTAILVDASHRVRYRGLIDDHKIEEFVRHPYLRRALEAVLGGKEVETRSTAPVGCSLKVGEKKSSSDEVTYGRHVAPILNRSCISCHRPGQVGPFSLETYEQARAWSGEIVSYTKTREMPPWKPVTNIGAYYNERRLPEAELEILERWHRNGAPLGDAKDLSAPVKHDDAWMLGTPDAVLKAEGGYVLGARGADEYRCYVLENTFDEDKWVAGVEYRPGNMRAVHHIIAYLDLAGGSARKDKADPLPGYKSSGSGPNVLPSGSLGGWAPGNLPRMLPEGVGRLLRKGERIVLETHYHKSGRPEKDGGAELALHFAKAPVKKKFQIHMVVNPLLRIPAGAEAHKVLAGWIVPRDLTARDVMPHMHLLGRSMSIVATLPDGTKKDLVVVKDWDFNWQETYQFKEPVALPKGTRVRLEAVYNNSLNNPNNPSNPPRDVSWGEETTDEMCIGFVGYTVDAEDRTKKAEEK